MFISQVHDDLRHVDVLDCILNGLPCIRSAIEPVNYKVVDVAKQEKVSCYVHVVDDVVNKLKSHFNLTHATDVLLAGGVASRIVT